MNKTLLSLFDYSGSWSMPYLKNGWNVIQIDKKLGIDILDIDAGWFYENIFDSFECVNGILAAPPCTDFASCGAQYWSVKDLNGSTKNSIELVYQVLRIVDLCKPDFWALENPVGRISQLVPELGRPRYFDPYNFGDPYTKKTALFGEFKMPHKTNKLGLFHELDSDFIDEVKPVKSCSQGSFLQKLGGKGEKTKEIRSLTPCGFAEAFYRFNH